MPRVPMIQVATDVRDVANILIAKYHAHLSDANILYLFTDQKRKKCDRVRVGSAARLNSLQRFLASHLESVESGPELLVYIDVDEWSRMDEAAQRRLTDHELEHIKIFVKSGFSWIRLPEDESKEDYAEWRYGLIGHDLEDFASIVSRHGWPTGEHEDRFKEVAMKQIPLPEMRVAISRN